MVLLLVFLFLFFFLSNPLLHVPPVRSLSLGCSSAYLIPSPPKLQPFLPPCQCKRKPLSPPLWGCISPWSPGVLPVYALAARPRCLLVATCFLSLALICDFFAIVVVTLSQVVLPFQGSSHAITAPPGPSVQK